MVCASPAQWATVIVTLAVGVIALWVQKSIAAQQRTIQKEIADRQAKIDEDKIRLDLFDRRFAVCVSSEKLVLESLDGASRQFDAALSEFRMKQREAQFLFSNALDAPLAELLKAVLEFYDLDHRGRQLGEGAHELSAKHESARKSMWMRWDDCQPVFSRFMHFEH